jgi:hypothetical protein
MTEEERNRLAMDAWRKAVASSGRPADYGQILAKHELQLTPPGLILGKGPEAEAEQADKANFARLAAQQELKLQKLRHKDEENARLTQQTLPKPQAPERLPNWLRQYIKTWVQKQPGSSFVEVGDSRPRSPVGAQNLSEEDERRLAMEAWSKVVSSDGQPPPGGLQQQGQGLREAMSGARQKLQGQTRPGQMTQGQGLQPLPQPLPMNQLPSWLQEWVRKWIQNQTASSAPPSYSGKRKIDQSPDNPEWYW